MSLKKAAAAILICLLTVVFAMQSWASSLDKVRFIKIAPQDAKAVIKGEDGKLRIIKVGDSIGENVKVTEIASGRIVLEEKTDKGTETVIVRVEKGTQRIERITKKADLRPVAVTPGKSQK